ncbi:unnamed protein product [Diatraea saccharalis]|uniref:Uncharacterized protein n=1 Tax=Diatraea saccharalis TaxID=40085 RepID=A0A9P0G0F5_9NEOP|nr:unnamed protein product [Diatraea saccharalis]
MQLPPRLGCCMLWAAVVGNIVSIANVVTHCADNLELFHDAADRRHEIREFKRTYSSSSDHAALHKIQNEFESVRDKMGKIYSQQWCERRHLRWDRLDYVRKVSNLHLENILKSGFLEQNPDPSELTRFSDVDQLTAAILLAGSNSLLTTKRHIKTKGKLATVVEVYTTKGDRAHIGNESVNHSISKRTSKTQLLTYYGGQHSNERRALVVYKTSVVPPHTALLFCKGEIRTEEANTDECNMTNFLLPNHKLQVLVPSSQASTFLKAREMLWNTFQYYIERDLKSIPYDDHVTISRFTARLIKSVTKILSEAHREYAVRERSLFSDEDDEI